MKLNIRNQKSPAQRISGTGARGFHFIGKTLILLWCGLTVAILVWVVAASLTSTKDIFQNDLLKGGIDLTGYKIVIERYHIMDYFFNSVLYTVCACVGLIFFCAPAAFVITKFQFRGRKIFQVLFSISLGLPGVIDRKSVV